MPVGALLVHSGGEVKVDADEEYSSVVMARLDAEPVTTATSLAEVARLLRDVGISITVTGGVIDRDVPAGLVYDESRMDAVEDHLDRVQAAHRMTGDGSIEIVPVAGVGPVWEIGGGDAGVLIDVNRASSDDGFYNQVISRGETEDGQQLRGYAELPAEHPLSPRGPMGPVPMFHRSPAKTADGVQADADTLLWNRTDSGEVSVHVTCLLHPGLQLHDLVNLNMPTRAGEQQIPGRVVAMAFGSTSGTPSKSMEIELKVSSDLLMAVAWRVRYGA
ncbi:MAG: hypothetical protein EON52_28340 [Actinomycetales bacterium]|nr:MAG: hypothetical protein EON52_28340 [Actinomycetales bacterium]